MLEKERNRILAEIYSNYKETMFYTAFQILRNYHEAEDAVSDAYIKLIQYLDKIDLKDCYKTQKFIVIVTKSAAIDVFVK